MPNIETNIEMWTKYDWSQKGNEWSAYWGNEVAQWHGDIFQRIKNFLPAKNVLEIAPGYGRWTQFLLHLAEKLTLVDLAENCIDACKERFQAYNHIEYHVNNGKSLPMIPDNSIDFIFSFDSLVHAATDAMEGYIKEFSRVLKPEGFAFIHHSNLADVTEIKVESNLIDKIQYRLGTKSRPSHPKLSSQNRAKDVSANVIQELCQASNLHVVSQELVNWLNPVEYLIDCFTLLTPVSASTAGKQTMVWKNIEFMQHVSYVKTFAKYYQ